MPGRAEATLGIGDDAPQLDIEHYIQDGNGFFGEVEKFEDGKVYVVEFWATWCGPCIQSMPHLAELQNKYRGQDVQIISVTDEGLAKVKELMEQDYPGGDKTFAEVTSAYTLTSDPDGSTNEDYMQAAEQNGIPASFLVGKSGKIEWIGHPMQLDEPLTKVIEDTWDRDAYKKQMERQRQLESSMNKIYRLAGQGNFEDAIKVVDRTIAEIKQEKDDPSIEMAVQTLTNLRFNLRLDSGDTSEEVLTYFRNQLTAAKGQPQQIAQFAYGLMGAMQQGSDPGVLANETIDALEAEVDAADAEIKPLLYVLIGQINAAMSKFDEALKAQLKAVETSTGRQKERMEAMLSELKEIVAQQSKKEKQSGEKEKAKQKVSE